MISFETKRFLGKTIRWSAITGFSICSFQVIATMMAFASPDSYGLIGGYGLSIIISILLFVLCLITFVIGALMALFPLHRYGVGVMIASVIIAVLIGVGSELAYEVQNQRLLEMTEEAKPLIVAIDAYEAKYGTPPRKLEDLVPEFLPQVPGTGLTISPTFQYRTYAPGQDGWRISVWVPGTLLGESLTYDRTIAESERRGRLGEWYWGGDDW